MNDENNIISELPWELWDVQYIDVLRALSDLRGALAALDNLPVNCSWETNRKLEEAYSGVAAAWNVALDELRACEKGIGGSVKACLYILDKNQDDREIMELAATRLCTVLSE